MLANGDQLSCYNFLDELELEVQVQVQDCEGLVLVEDGTAAMKGFVQHLKVSQLEVVGLKQESDLLHLDHLQGKVLQAVHHGIFGG